MRLLALAIVGFPLLSLTFTSCSDDDESSPPSSSATGTIGPEGGSISVASGPLAGTTLTIPPGALTAPVAFSIFEDYVTLVPGFVDVGPAVHIEPSTTLGLPATLKLPFDPTRVPPPTTTADYVVRERNTTGQVADLAPSHVDQATGLVTIQVPQMLTWWVSVPDVIDMRSYLPLGAGDVYAYDTGLFLSVQETRTEPNFLGLPLTKLMFSQLAFFTGFYLTEDAKGALSLFGEFEVAVANRQERLASSVLMLDSTEVVGTQRDVFYSFTGFVPYGSPLPFYIGSAHMRVSVVKHTSVGTPLGSFDDVVLLELVIERNDSRPQYGTYAYRMWLANGVGPVQVDLNGMSTHRLVQAIVGGKPIER